MEITREIPIKFLLKEIPEAEEILMMYGLQCVNCHFSDVDTLGGGASMHGLSEQDIEDIIKDITSVMKNNS